VARQVGRGDRGRAPRAPQDDGRVACAIGNRLLGLGPDSRMAGASRPMVTPELLSWLAGALDLDGHGHLLELGGGLGGSAAWAASRLDRPVLLVDPRTPVVEVARALFPGLHAAAATPDQLPLADGSCRAAWVLDALDDLADGFGALQELRRVVRPGGMVGVLALVAVGGRSREAREAADGRWSEPELVDMCQLAGLRMRHQVDAAALAGTPTSWRLVQAEVRAHLERGAAEGDELLAGALRQHRLVERQLQARLLLPRVYLAEVVARPRRRSP